VAQTQAFKTTQEEKALDGTLCTICTFVTNIVEEYVQNNATEQKIEQLLGKVCNLFGGFQSECQDFVNSEVPAIIQLLLDMKALPSSASNFMLAPARCSRSQSKSQSKRLLNLNKAVLFALFAKLLFLLWSLT